MSARDDPAQFDPCRSPRYPLLAHCTQGAGRSGGVPSPATAVLRRTTEGARAATREAQATPYIVIVCGLAAAAPF
jgi:predicted protein tyrosine phosphatase